MGMTTVSLRESMSFSSLLVRVLTMSTPSILYLDPVVQVLYTNTSLRVSNRYDRIFDASEMRKAAHNEIQGPGQAHPRNSEESQ